MSDEILEPPGSIAILGGGLLGLEAALYGRFLGYEVQVFEASEIGQPWLHQGDAALDFLPARGISELALQAIRAQQNAQDEVLALPTTARQWAEEIVLALAEVDLLAGRVHAQHRVTAIDRVPNEDEPSELDFRIHCDSCEAPWYSEAVIDTVDWSLQAGENFGQPLGETVPYFYRLRLNESDPDGPPTANWEQRSRAGREQIRQLFAALGDRPTLDLYRPRRL